MDYSVEKELAVWLPSKSSSQGTDVQVESCDVCLSHLPQSPCAHLLCAHVRFLLPNLTCLEHHWIFKSKSVWEAAQHSSLSNNRIRDFFFLFLVRIQIIRLFLQLAYRYFNCSFQVILNLHHIYYHVMALLLLWLGLLQSTKTNTSKQPI